MVCSLGLGTQSHAEDEASIGSTASVGFSGEYVEKEPPHINPDGPGDNSGGNSGGSGSHTGSRPPYGSTSRPGGTSSNGSTSRYPSGSSTHSGGSSSSNGNVLPKLGTISQTVYSSYGIILMGLMSILIYKENKNKKEIL